MQIYHLKMNNFTVFEELDIDFEKGINILIGENGTGKTHILKLLYSACQATDPKVSFPNKLVRVMLPDEYKILRLITRHPGNRSTEIKVAAQSDDNSAEKNLSLSFNNKTKKWDALVRGKEGWEKAFPKMSSIFIPAKEILSNSFNLAAAVDKNNVKFDDTYIDIIHSAKVDISVGRNSVEKDKRLKKIEEIIDGTVFYDAQKDEFYLKKGQSKQEFSLVAEGIRKMALLWQLVKNGTLEKGSVLFWDEPEANINPQYIPIIVELILALQRDGVQVFLSTHDYVVAKYFEVRKQSGDRIMFHSFDHDEGGNIRYNRSESFEKLKGNKIIQSFNNLLDEIYAEGARQSGDFN